MLAWPNLVYKYVVCTLLRHKSFNDKTNCKINLLTFKNILSMSPIYTPVSRTQTNAHNSEAVCVGRTIELGVLEFQKLVRISYLNLWF